MPRNLHFAIAFLLLFPAAAAAERAQTFIGNTTQGASWVRPHPSGEDLSGIPGTQRFIAQPFQVFGNATCSFYSSQEFDGLIFLYIDEFNPSFPFSFIDAPGSDDSPSGNIGTSVIENRVLHGDAEGRTFILVTTGFDSAEHGAFHNFIKCDGNIQPVQGSCGIQVGVPPQNSICLANRFLVSITNISNSPTGIATPVRAGSTDTGLFWFYNDRNWEVMAKVVNGCAVNNRWWFFAGSLTNQRYRITVRDTKTGATKIYNNTEGVNAPAIADSNAFATCP